MEKDALSAQLFTALITTRESKTNKTPFFPGACDCVCVMSL